MNRQLPSFVFLLLILSLPFTGIPASAQLTRTDSLLVRLQRAAEQKGAAGDLGRCQLFFLKQDIDPENTREWVESSITRFKRAGDAKKEAWFRTFKGVLLNRGGEIKASLSILREVLESAGALKVPELEGVVQVHIANLYRSNGQYDSAQSAYLQAERLLKNQPPFYRFLLGAHRVVFFNLWHQMDSAQHHLNELRSLIRNPDIGYLRFYMFYLNGETARNQARFTEANRQIDMLLSQAGAYSLPYLVGLETKAALSYLNGDFQNMIGLYSQVLSDEKRLRLISHFDLAFLFFNLSEGFDSQGQYDLAMQYVNKAIEMASEAGYQNLLGKCFLEVAWLSYARGDYGAAEQELKSSEELFRSTKDEHSRTSVTNLLATIRGKQGRFDEALALHEQCLRDRRSLNDPYLISSSLYNMAELFNETGRFAKALPLYQSGLAIDLKTGDRYGISSYYNGMSIAHRGLGRTDSCVWYLKKSIDIAEPAGSADVLKQAFQILSEVYTQRGEYRQANDYLNRFINIQNQLSSRESSQNLAAYRTLFELGNKDRQIRLLNQEKSLQETLVENQRTFLYLLVSGIVLMGIVAVVFYRLSRKMRLLNHINEERATMLDEKNSALQKTMEDLKKTQDQLIVSEKMATLGVLSFGVAHELNNPLNFIRGGAIALKQELGKPEPDRTNLNQLMDAIDEGVRRSASIIQGLRHYSHTSENTDENCDIHLIVDNCLLILENKLRHRINVIREYSSEKIEVKGNTGRLHQALLNLLANAEQAIADKGTITVRTARQGGKTYVAIEDTGCGIPPENMNRLGDLFFTTKAPGQGTGFGLSISYRVIGEMRGKIEVRSQVGQGTQFQLIFPGS